MSMQAQTIRLPRMLGWILLPLNAIVAALVLLFFHYDPAVVLDPILLLLVTVPSGVLYVGWLETNYHFKVDDFERIALGSALGFGFLYFWIHLLQLLGAPPSAAYGFFVLPVVSLWENVKYREGGPEHGGSHPFAWFNLLGLASLAIVALYILPNIHFTSLGSVSATGLFAQDIPWLAGTVHGIREFGSISDLHQDLTPMHYHEAIYQVLAMLPKAHTLQDLAFSAPFAGYTLLAFSVFALTRRFTHNDTVAALVSLAWFLTGGVLGAEESSYALSPSLVFGSILLVNLILLVDMRYTARAERPVVAREEAEPPDTKETGRIAWSATFLILLFLLSQTKLSTYLLATAAIGLVALAGVRRSHKATIDILIPVALVFAFALWQASRPNPLMPGGDFLIGAPLLGYANHVASIVKIGVRSISPVSSPGAWHVQSLLIVPYFIFHFLRFVLLDPRLIAVVVLLVVAYRKRSPMAIAPESRWILLVLIPMGFLLPVLYSPAWYPLAFSFYAPLTSAQAALLLIPALAFGVQTQARSKTLRIVGILALLSVVCCMRELVRDSRQETVAVPAGVRTALDTLSQLAPTNATVATLRHDLIAPHDESYYWDAALGGHPVITEGAKYGSLLAAVADRDSIKGLHPAIAAQRRLAQLRALDSTIFFGQDDSLVLRSIRAARVRFLFFDKASGYTPSAALQRLAIPAYRNAEAEIWRIRPDLQLGDLPLPEGLD